MIHPRQVSIVAGFALLGAAIGVAIVLALAGPAWPALLRVGVVGALVGAVVAAMPPPRGWRVGRRARRKVMPPPGLRAV